MCPTYQQTHPLHCRMPCSLYTDDIPPHVAYNHIHLVAKELPPRTFVSEVCAALNQWWAKHPDDYVAMHCAYGFNRCVSKRRVAGCAHGCMADCGVATVCCMYSNVGM